MTNPTPPAWLKPMNKVFVAGQRAGLKMGGMHILSVPGRVSGKIRRTPLTVVEMDGERYLMEGFPGADWARNLRAADGLATMSVGKRSESIRLVELDAESARPVLRHWPSQVPDGSIQFLRDAGLVVRGTPDEYEALAGRCGIFRITPA